MDLHALELPEQDLAPIEHLPQSVEGSGQVDGAQVGQAVVDAFHHHSVLGVSGTGEPVESSGSGLGSFQDGQDGYEVFGEARTELECVEVLLGDVGDDEEGSDEIRAGVVKEVGVGSGVPGVGRGRE